MTAYSKPIICCGFTPCVQRIVEFDKISKGAVNRAKKVTVCVGGKGANTARMIRQLAGNVRLIGFSGGSNGRLLEAMLAADGVDYQHVDVAGETRICQTLVERGNPETTELVEEMPPVSRQEWSAMAALIQSLDLDGALVPVSGKLPAGAPMDAYAQIAALVSGNGGRLVLDVPGEPLLLALEHRPFMVKINEEELFQAVGGRDVFSACRELRRRGAQSVLITRGPRSAFYADTEQTLEIFPPNIQAVNPIGSGDAVTAGLAVELNRGSDIVDAVVAGMACGAANALNLISGMIKPEDVQRLRGEVRCVSRS